jgi:hypothetical protein
MSKLWRMIALAASGTSFFLPVAAVAAPASVPAYRIMSSTPLVLLDATDAPPAGLRTAMAGELILKAPVAYAEVAFVAASREVVVADVAEKLEPTQRLSRVTAKGGDLQTLGPTAAIYCAEWRQTQKPSIAAALTLGLTDIGKRLSRETQLCLVDGDADGQFERAFLIGTKLDADRHMVAIAPLAYRTAKDEPIADSAVGIYYRKGALLQGAILSMEMQVEGRPMGVASYMLKTAAMPKPRFFAAERGVKASAYPKAIDFGAAALSIESFDPVSKAIGVRVVRDFERAEAALSFPVQTIYIYIPAG